MMEWILLIFVLYANDGTPALNTMIFEEYSQCEETRLELMRAANVGKAFCFGVYE